MYIHFYSPSENRQQLSPVRWALGSLPLTLPVATGGPGMSVFPSLGGLRGRDISPFFNASSNPQLRDDTVYLFPGV